MLVRKYASAINAATPANPAITAHGPKVAATAPSRDSSANERDPAGRVRLWLRSRSKPSSRPIARATR